MEKIYEQSKDLHVRSLVVYGKAADHKLYANADYDAYLDAAAVKDAFIKDMVVILDGTTYKMPISLDADGKYVTVETVTNAVALVEWTVAVAA